MALCARSGTKVPPPPAPHFCAPCGIDLQSALSLAGNIAGRRHRKKAGLPRARPEVAAAQQAFEGVPPPQAEEMQQRPHEQPWQAYETAKQRQLQQQWQQPLVRVSIVPPRMKDAGLTCFVLKGVLAPAECEALIVATEGRGYAAALINGGGRMQTLDTDTRKSGRVIVDDKPTAVDWFGRIAGHLPQAIGRGGRVADEGARKLVGLNERLRFLRYHPGEYFAPHQDGSYRRPDGSESSLLTMMLYLNTSDKGAAAASGGGGSGQGCFGGGETNFLDVADLQARAGRRGNAVGEANSGTGKKASVVPEVGDVLIFDHSLLHEGAAVTRGVKYAVRTDVMYTIPQGQAKLTKQEQKARNRGPARERHLQSDYS